jgi:hypothetical protein
VVARLVPASASDIPEPARSTEALDALFERYTRPMGGKPFVRDDSYDRGDLGE